MNNQTVLLEKTRDFCYNIKAKISKSTLYKIKNNENVNTDILLRICNVLDCDISELVECVKND